MENDLLKKRIVDFVDRVKRMSRRDAIDELYDMIKEYQLLETKDGILSYSDLNRIHDLALNQFQDLSLPFYVDGQETSKNQRHTYCYLMAVIMYLRSLKMLKRMISVDSRVPIIEPIED